MIDAARLHPRRVPAFIQEFKYDFEEFFLDLTTYAEETNKSLSYNNTP